MAFLRLLTSSQIRLDPDLFAPFLFHPETGDQMDIIPFCQNWVEGAGKEAGMVFSTQPLFLFLTRLLKIIRKSLLYPERLAFPSMLHT